jgi:hypothetical protein
VRKSQITYLLKKLQLRCGKLVMDTVDVVKARPTSEMLLGAKINVRIFSKNALAIQTVQP